MKFERDDARIGLLVLVAAGLFGFLAVYHGVGWLGRPDVRHVVRLSDAAEIEVGTEVFLQGFRVGQVEEVELEREGNAYRFLAHLSLRPDLVLWRGTTGVVTARVMGGAVMELRLPPPEGRLVPLPPGEPMDGATSASVAALVAEMTELARNLNRATSELRDELSTNGLRAVFDHPKVSGALKEFAAALGTFRKASEVTTGTMAHGDRTLAKLDGALARLEGSLGELQGLLARRGPDLEAALAKLGPTLDEVGSAASEARRTLERLGPGADEGLASLNRTLVSLQELIELLKAKPNRIVFGTPSDEDRAAAKKRVDESAKEAGGAPGDPAKKD